MVRCACFAASVQVQRIVFFVYAYWWALQVVEDNLALTNGSPYLRLRVWLAQSRVKVLACHQ